jgi:uncharacterized protein YjbI with pentapeptide repeats
MKQSAFTKLVGLLLVFLASATHADIFQWEYIDPANPAQGKRQSTTLAPDGAGVDAAPGANLSYLNLTMAYLTYANMTNADLSQAKLTNAVLLSATLTDADFTGAEVRGASFGRYFEYETGITLAQLYSTASYQTHDLTGIELRGHDLSGGNFAGQNLANADFTYATLTGADFSGAVVRGANFDGWYSTVVTWGTGISLTQLYSTASYQAHDLGGISLSSNNLAAANFAGQNLTNARFSGATLNDAEFTNAEVRGANFSGTTYLGFTESQLYSTASYQMHDLTGINLDNNKLPGWNFAGQNLTDANFYVATLMGADFSKASLSNADFRYAELTDADFTDAEVRGAMFGSAITLAQLYSTASYSAHDLTGIGVSGDLSGANFARQNLMNADFGAAMLSGANFREANLTNANFAVYIFCIPVYGCDPYSSYYFENATLTNADLTGADARGAFGLDVFDTTTSNLIRPDGHIDGLQLDVAELLVVRDYDGNPIPSSISPWLPEPSPIPPIPVTVDQHLAMGPGGTLRIVFEADAWDSTISFAPGIPVALGGTLELTFAADVNLATQLGRTFDFFNWTGVHPTGAFAVSSPYRWNLSNLYTTGQVTFTAIPEPATVVLLALAAGMCAKRRRTKACVSQLIPA